MLPRRNQAKITLYVWQMALAIISIKNMKWVGPLNSNPHPTNVNP